MDQQRLKRKGIKGLSPLELSKKIGNNITKMSPTVFRHKNFRFFFFSREEKRMHVHVSCPDGEAKFWLEPIVELDHNYGLKSRKLKDLEIIIKERKDEIIRDWKKHFTS